MGSFQKRGGKWRARVLVNGERVSATFDSKAQATAWAAQQSTETGKARGSTHKTLDDALERYAREESPRRRGKLWEQTRIKAFRRLKFVHRRLSDLSSDDFGRWRDQRLQECKPGTVLRELNLWASVFEAARIEWKWVAGNPIRDVRKPAQPKSRSRVIAAEERDAMVGKLGYTGGVPETKSQEVALAFLIALETSMRAGEITGLRRRDLHLEERYLHLPMTKNGHSRDVPLSNDAVEMLKLAPGEDLLWTFTSATRDALFRKARKSAGLDGFTFHDARRTATTRLATKLDPMELARVTGHLNINQIIKTYYAPKASDLAKKL